DTGFVTQFGTARLLFPAHSFGSSIDPVEKTHGQVHKTGPELAGTLYPRLPNPDISRALYRVCSGQMRYLVLRRLLLKMHQLLVSFDCDGVLSCRTEAQLSHHLSWMPPRPWLSCHQLAPLYRDASPALKSRDAPVSDPRSTEIQQFDLGSFFEAL